MVYNIEEFGNYRPGGYHTISIGDEFHNGRYRILHRLGHGLHSTVWLALNQHYQSNSYSNDLPHLRYRYVAVKILAADAPDEKYDGHILRQLRPEPQPKDIFAYIFLRLFDTPKDARETSGGEFVVSLLDEFEVQGPNGLHRCVVTELLGPTVKAIKSCSENAGLLPLEIGRRIIVQCAKGLAFLHSHGIVHGGLYALTLSECRANWLDLHLGNMAFTMPNINLNSYTVDELYAAIGQPVVVPADTHPLWREGSDFISHQPEFLVDTPPVAKLWSLCSCSLPGPSIRLIDFTESFHIPFNPDHNDPGTPLGLAAPELILGFSSEVTTSVDIWAFACTCWEILGRGCLFKAIFNTRAEILADMIFFLGGKERENIPERFWSFFGGKLGGERWFDQNGQAVSGRAKDWMGGTQGWLNWEERIEHLRGSGDDALSGEDQEVLRKVLKAALLFEPSKRATAKEIVQMVSEIWRK